jgi:hypothetical protein
MPKPRQGWPNTLVAGTLRSPTRISLPGDRRRIRPARVDHAVRFRSLDSGLREALHGRTRNTDALFSMLAESRGGKFGSFYAGIEPRAAAGRRDLNKGLRRKLIW